MWSTTPLLPNSYTPEQSIERSNGVGVDPYTRYKTGYDWSFALVLVINNCTSFNCTWCIPCSEGRGSRVDLQDFYPYQLTNGSRIQHHQLSSTKYLWLHCKSPSSKSKPMIDIDNFDLISIYNSKPTHDTDCNWWPIAGGFFCAHRTLYHISAWTENARPQITKHAWCC